MYYISNILCVACVCRHYYELLLSEGFELIAGPDPVRPWIGFRMKPSGGVPLKGAYRNVLVSSTINLMQICNLDE